MMAKFSQSGLKLECRGFSLRIDQEGRWCSFRQGGRFYRRGVDGSVISTEPKRYAREPISCNDEQTRQLLNDIHRHLRQSLSLADNPQNYELKTGTPTEFKALLKRCLIQDWSYYQTQQALFDQAYVEPVPILPPDRYRDLVILPAIGCPNRRCTFCAFYRDRPFGVLTAKELDQHIASVQKLFGSAVPGRNGIFLGSANGMVLSQRRLLIALDKIRGTFGIPKRGIASFFDPYFSPQRSLSQWQELLRAGLTRVVIGLESGVPLVRHQLGKNPNLSLLLQQAALVKQAGIKLGITVLVGAGGKTLERRHVNQTTQLLGSMGLDNGDLIYLSPLDLGVLSPESKLVERQLEKFKHQLCQAKLVAYQKDHYRYYS